ncbi:MAG: hypothetical protein H6662_02215 [Ardenticatenaceae bacterium]|nr:hypothetical protein [Anaerolineales bacterium]MCB8920375.1 hypothetical protein [Ardenticatenaceae bacterium]MCB8989330.1 hypothetical protein [Ardenticatenaceae bacterium]
MAKKKRSQQSRQSKDKKEKQEAAIVGGDPWISQRSGLTVIGMLSIGMFIYMVWQLYPTEGWGNALLWGLGFFVGIWVIFGISLAFNLWMRGRRQGGK